MTFAIIFHLASETLQDEGRSETLLEFHLFVWSIFVIVIVIIHLLSSQKVVNTLEPHYNSIFGVHSVIRVITEQCYNELE